MQRLIQTPTDPAFVQDPYPFYARARAAGDIVHWDGYGICATSHAAVTALLKDRRLGREIPAETAPDIPARLRPFYDIEAHSMLELEPPRHTRLRGLVLRAFTSRRIAALAPGIEALAHDLVDAFPAGRFDLLDAYCRWIPARTICRLLGVPQDIAPQLLDWSNAMVAIYQARRSRAIEDAACAAATDFASFIRGYVDSRRDAPGDDLISELIAAEEAGEKLTTDELITTCILLLNAGHEATVHAMGNAVRGLLATGHRGITDRLVEETLRHDPPLHLFQRWAYADFTAFGHAFRRGDQVNCLLACANRDPAAYPDPDRFDPDRAGPTNASFGGGIHFCVGAPLARLELKIGLQVLFDRCPDLTAAGPAPYADLYHFHGLKALPVRAAPA
ncbi:MAG: unspecific monooxygenase [Rhodobacteraceae bacterium HLUCCA08]|nr:MAG: unspecific monooxygenase [Rhodobacteraceae bacterium HLUCCA08]